MKKFCRTTWEPKPGEIIKLLAPVSSLYFCRICGSVMKPTPLSSKEVTILRAYAAGLSTAQIAEMEFISFKTVEAHRQKIMLKMGVPNIISAVVVGIKHGIVILSDSFSTDIECLNKEE